MSWITCESLTRTYRRGTVEVTPLREVDLTIEQGEFVALMGPSGSGKTTLLNLIAGIDQPTSGHLTVGGADLGEMSRSRLATWRSRHVGYIFQLYHLAPTLTAWENVELPLLLHRLTGKERRRRVWLALELAGIADRADHFPRQLSGGQEQRVAIARAIVSDPPMLVADEPTGDLDASAARATMQLLSRLHNELGKTIVMVTHDPHSAQWAQRLLHLEKGRILDAPSPEATPEAASETESEVAHV